VQIVGFIICISRTIARYRNEYSQRPLQRKTIQACYNFKKVQISALQWKALQGADRHQTTRSHNQERQSYNQHKCLRFEVRCNSTLIYKLCYRDENSLTQCSTFVLWSTVIPRLTKIIRSGITIVSRNMISRRFL